MAGKGYEWVEHRSDKMICFLTILSVGKLLVCIKNTFFQMIFLCSRGFQEDTRQQIYAMKSSDPGSALLPPNMGAADMRRISYDYRRPSSANTMDYRRSSSIVMDYRRPSTAAVEYHNKHPSTIPAESRRMSSVDYRHPAIRNESRSHSNTSRAAVVSIDTRGAPSADSRPCSIALDPQGTATFSQSLPFLY